MDDSLLARLLMWLPQFVVAAAVVVALATMAVWALGRLIGRGEFQSLEAVSTVMAATVLRRDRRETLSRILELSREQLGAVSGSLHLAQGAAGLKLVSAVGVRRLDLLADIRSDDALVKSLTAEPSVATIGLFSPWAALSEGEPFSMVAVLLRGAQARGLLVLCWPKRLRAEACLPALAQIGWYAGQVLAELDGLEQQAHDLQALNDTLQQRDRLARTAAHDMGNKLANSQNVLGLLEMEPALGDEYRGLVVSARQQVDLLAQMLSEFTDPGRALVLARVPVEDIVSVATAMVPPGTCDFSVDVLTGLPDIWGERLSILRVLDNLLRNALQHNADESHLRVWLRVRLDDDEQLLFEVGDSGQGIPVEAQGRLFEFGFRADSTGKVKGCGLGLWSCKRLVEAQGGRIWVKSLAGQGAKFFFMLPAMLDVYMTPGN